MRASVPCPGGEAAAALWQGVTTPLLALARAGQLLLLHPGSQAHCIVVDPRIWWLSSPTEVTVGSCSGLHGEHRAPAAVPVGPRTAERARGRAHPPGRSLAHPQSDAHRSRGCSRQPGCTAAVVGWSPAARSAAQRAGPVHGGQGVAAAQPRAGAHSGRVSVDDGATDGERCEHGSHSLSVLASSALSPLLFLSSSRLLQS